MDETEMISDFRFALQVGAAEAVVKNVNDKVMPSVTKINDKVNEVLSKDALERRCKFLHLDGGCP